MTRPAMTRLPIGALLGTRRTLAPWLAMTLAVIALLAGVAVPLLAQFPPEIRGRVVARPDGAALAGARVEVDGGGQRAVTAVDGAFVLRGIEPGAHVLRVTLLGYAPARRAVDVANGEVARVVVALDPVPVELAGVRVVAERRRAPADALVLERSRIEASGAAELGELLEGEAGLTVVRRGGPGSPATLSVRGGSADQVLVLVDGVAVNQPLTGEADLSAVPLEIVERVTVLRGAQSARYGARALSGVVAVETRDPRRAEVGVRVDAAAFGERGGALTLGHRLPMRGAGLGALVTAEAHTVDGDFTYDVPAVRGGGRATRHNAGADRRSLLATTSYERAAFEARLRGEAFDVDRGMPGSVVQPSLQARQEQRRLGLGLSVRGERGPWEWSADASERWQRAVYADDAPPVGTPYDDSVRVRSLVAAAALTAHFPAAALAVGAELRRTAFAATTLAERAPPADRLAGVWTSARLWRDVTLGARSGIPLRAELQAGVRADRSSLLGAAQLSPRVGVSVGGARATGRVTWGRAFSPPSLADQFFQEGVRARPNPALRPERVRDEVEGSLELRGRLGPAELDATGTAYRADVEGMILWFPDFRFVWSPQNQDVVRRGWEVAAQAGVPWAAARLRTAVSHARVEYAGPVLAGQVAYRPALTATAGAGVTVAGVRADLEARHVGVRRVSPGTSVNQLSPFQVVDVRLARDFALRDWAAELSAGVENLLDEQAAMLADYPQAGRRWTTGIRLRRGRGSSAAPDDRTAVDP